MAKLQSKLPELLSGRFDDGPLVGLGYRTASQQGVTDEQGRFFYQPGEIVSFSIGNLSIGSALGGSLTLATLRDSVTELGNPDLALPETVNRARFIQSLAVETDLRNGVSIDDTVRDIVNRHADGISFTSDIKTFEQSPAVRAVFSELGSRFRGVEEARNHLRRAQAGIKALRDVRVPTRDNSYLLADVFHPIDAGRYPVLLRLGIYGRAFRVGAISNDEDREISEKREDSWFQGDRDNLHPYWRWSENAASASPSVWVPRGYVVVLVDGRGVGNVPGKLSPYSKQEARDYYDAIEWAAKQPWSDGNVGLYGASYNATTQWHVAALHPPSLKAMAPISADGDIRDLAYPDYVGGLRSHPWDDEYYYGNGALSADFPSIDIPVLTAVSMTNTIHPRSGFEAFSSLSSRVKRLMVMDAVYSGNMYKDFQPDLEAFFDQFLKGKKPVEEPPVVRMVLRTGDGGWQWRTASTWPVPNTEYRELFLGATNASIGHISTRAPSQEGVAEYSADIEDGNKAILMAVFESAPLEEDLELVGHFRATLWVSSTTSDADVFVALRVMDGEREAPYRTYETKSAAPLTWGCLKVSRRATDPERSTAERPWHTHRREDAQSLVLGEVVKIEVEIMPATGRVLKGHRLRVEISPVEGPGCPPGWEREYDASYHAGATNRILTGASFPSSITIPVVPREDLKMVTACE
ncbi:PepX_C domain-containing protein [Trichoderma simmonsii]|uniref:PepX_C domain-containing protein n=1 Tax=Trichoderma simmonsii TaxID=1491479 RepID=A0A8G0L075_9HYPO|nr:PepX_C domain-containing protein [Trichoderma simmonsii]